jgi:aminopeptidase
MDDLYQAALIALRDCMGVKSNETLLVLSDDQTHSIGNALFETGKKLSKECVWTVIAERKVNGEDPPPAIAELMKLFDVVICPTAKSLTHTNARRNACAAGARVGTMPGINEEVMIRTLKANYHKIAERTYILSELLEKGREVHITTALGTDIRIPIDGIHAISSTGLVLESGKFGNLPSGESYLMPVEGKTQGVFFVDGSFAGVGKIGKDPIKISVRDGFAEKIEGGEEARILNEILKPLGKKAYNIAELGIGTNDEAIITGKILEDEKVMGTVHIALGNNKSMGGTCDVGIHLDGVMLEPTVSIDGKILMQVGKFTDKDLL